jgi:hypothetical protein
LLAPADAGKENDDSRRAKRACERDTITRRSAPGTGRDTMTIMMRAQWTGPPSQGIYRAQTMDFREGKGWGEG